MKLFIIGAVCFLALTATSTSCSPLQEVREKRLTTNLGNVEENAISKNEVGTADLSIKKQLDSDLPETELYESTSHGEDAGDDSEDKTLIPYMKPATGIVFAILYKVIWIVYKIGALVFRFWKYVLNLLFKPLLKLYLMPLRLIHTYLLPDLISEECFKDYHTFIHAKNDPYAPFRPHKWELVKCIFQYAFHYVRQWMFVNRIENNNYALI